MKKIFSFFLLLGHIIGTAQIIELLPSGAGSDDEITLIFDAAQGNKELKGASKVYIHHGVVTDGPNGTSWTLVKGNWGKDDGIGLMTKVPGSDDKWQIKFTPTLRQYFNANANTNLFRIACVFRNPDGSKKGTTQAGNYGWGIVANNLDYYINLNTNNYISIEEPFDSEAYLNQGEKLKIKASASALATSIKLFVNQNNAGYNLIHEVSNTKSIAHDLSLTSSSELNIKIEATIGSETIVTEKKINAIVIQANPIEELPAGVLPGINYVDSASCILVLEAPFKKFAYVVGDFNDWRPGDNNQMNRASNEKYFWIKLNNLIPGKEYAFQYWVDGKIKIADPYAEKIADPWNDSFIETSVYPNPIKYDKKEYGIASVLQTKQHPYIWPASENAYVRPEVNHIVIYELHIRDFLKSHSYSDLIDTISYLKRLGVDAIELMPISEFEGNDSWGYNPSFYFAPDKYYGTKDQLKKFIESCHKEGIAVILDIVLNHAYGQNPMVQLYQEGGKPAANNPWFNREYVGQYQWGYDFNHESNATKEFVDRVNKFWLEEYHFDGYRFDFTKGFTNNAPGGSIDGFDQSRINIIKRMADKIKTVDPKAYIILEHWAPNEEEVILGNYGLKMWRNKTYDYSRALLGFNEGSFSSMNSTTHIPLYNSHDEQRVAFLALNEGNSADGYNIKLKEVMLERIKMLAAFVFLFPGPKMIWQFDELAYDIDINFNGRIGRKPYAWGSGSLGYYEDTERQNVFNAYKGILDVRKKIGPGSLANATTNHKINGSTRRLSYNTNGIDLVVIANFGVKKETINPAFTGTGKWFNYFSGDSIAISNATASISLEPGEWHIYTSEKISSGQPGVVSTYKNPVTITPSVFNKDTEITIQFDARKADPGQSAGLIGANKIYMHSGVLKDASGNQWSNVVGTLQNDGVGEMTSIGNDIWQIKLIPSSYFGLQNDEEIFKIAMYFRDADNKNFGKGFKYKDLFFDVASNQPFITIDPPNFKSDDEITLTFNASQGNRELINESKIYMHSGVVKKNINAPTGSDWSNTVGNWSKDDGIGAMTKVPGSDYLWQIKLNTKQYYNLTDSEFPHWIAAVFRSADGNKKGTGKAGPLDNGFIASNLDFFIRNQRSLEALENIFDKIKIYPNPAKDFLSIDGVGQDTKFDLFDLMGNRMILNEPLDDQLNIMHIPNGLYVLKLIKEGKFKNYLIVKEQ